MQAADAMLASLHCYAQLYSHSRSHEVSIIISLSVLPDLNQPIDFPIYYDIILYTILRKKDIILYTY